MARQSATEIDQMIQRVRPTNRDLVRRDITQGIHSTTSSLNLTIVPYYYNNGTSKELLCLKGTVVCRYKGNQYNIPVEIFLQQDHPIVAPVAYVKPTPDMHVSTTSRDVQPDGTVIIPYLRNWRHPNSDLNHLINAMSDAFSQSPPVYSSGGSSSTTTTTNYATPYPTHTSMPIPPGMGMGGSTASTSHSYPYGYPQTEIPKDVYRESLQAAVVDLVRNRLNETIQIENAQIDSLKKIEYDLNDGEKKLHIFLRDIQQQQTQAQAYITGIREKTNDVLDRAQKMSSLGKENSPADDALITPAPVYKQLLQAYAEEHAIQDLLYYLADGLRREAIGLDVYLKHVRELSRKQFILRATMHKCRQIATPSIR
ncbi:unnamed protein product [Adineta steineri]|uniref:Tumor susceptibility gene 101 protein n=1 Tax=Adineta steineri TaxID=433720 RepID=A0A814K9D5_9BILA|nr:unnamed protein product [Adineta steineri]CAF3683293.1 unnamed protein product [Adineta steineri]